MKQLTVERDRFQRENATLKSAFEESQARVAVLENIVTDQKEELLSHIEQYCAEREETNQTHQQVI